MGQEDMRGVKGGAMRVSALKRRNYLFKLMYRGLINHCLRNLPSQFDGSIMPKPDAVDIYQTFRCNLRCKQCNSYKRNSGELDTDRWREIIVKLKSWLGDFRLRVCGGEPFLREDLLEVITFAHRLGIATVVTTNGTLIDGSISEKIIKSGLDFISISLDGIKEDTHDFLRGVPGAYKKAIQAIKLLKDEISVQICTTITNYNLDEISCLLKFADETGVKISFQGLFPQVENKSGSFDFKNWDIWPKDKIKLEYVFKELIKIKEKKQSIMNPVRQLQLIFSHYSSPERYMSYSCKAYKSNLRIMPDGNVQLCGQYGFIGNITGETPQSLWRSEKAELIRGEMKNCKQNCSFIRCYYYDTLFEEISKLKSLFLP